MSDSVTFNNLEIFVYIYLYEIYQLKMELNVKLNGKFNLAFGINYFQIYKMQQILIVYYTHN